MIKAECDSGVLNYYLRVTLKIGPLTICLNDDQSMNQEEAIALADELQAIADDVRNHANGLDIFRGRRSK